MPASDSQRAEKAVGQLNTFIERFDIDYDFEADAPIRLGSRLEAIGVELPELEERLGKQETEEQPLVDRLTELGVELAGFQ